jgi:hypothetical protein
MTWTYAGAPDDTTVAGRRDAVRLNIGDTDTNDQQITDEEITYFLDGANNNIFKAAIAACYAIASKYARLVDTSVESVSNSFSQRQTAYESLAARLQRQELTISGFGLPQAGGISISEMNSADTDTDRPTPAFNRKQFRNKTTIPDKTREWND